MSRVRRVYVEKQAAFDVRRKELLDEIRGFLGIDTVKNARVWIRYDVEHVPDDVFEAALSGVFAEPPVDLYHTESLPETEGPCAVFSVEALPGQYDQRADSAEQALRLIRDDLDPIVRCAVTYLLEGDVLPADVRRIQDHVCNPVDSRIAAEEKPETLVTVYDEPEDVARLAGFCVLEDDALHSLYESMSLAMTYADFRVIRDWFRDTERRDPSVTEIRVLDTYWSDHCRHTTFATEIRHVTFADGRFNEPVREAYAQYLAARNALYATPEKKAEKPVCLMDIALLAMKKLKADGTLTDMEESGENNACTVIVPVEIADEDGIRTEEWLVFFKNETHNHPTEIEPFGGAATCLGGAIRDPLSGRGYVYQAMRVTGAADPTRPASETMEGKLPQKKLVRDAARGYSSYGNQIGLATGLVEEIYHPGYVAKRMEIGAVTGAAPRKNVRRIEPEAGDVVILLGGRTGRDGIGGATGSSKAHSEESLATCGAEVQKGNAPTERKIQRLFRRGEVSRLIKKCNDFGAGGVCVAIGELAEGLLIDLDLVPKKYEGLDGTELAISESQERMAVVVAKEDEEAFLRYAAEENLEAHRVARVTGDGRLRMRWRGDTIVDLSRAFLDTNGAKQETEVHVNAPSDASYLRGIVSPEVQNALEKGGVRSAWLTLMRDLNVCSRKGLVEQFDASIGASSVLMPFGGKTQLTPVQAMTAKLPVSEGVTDAATAMSYGFDPYLSAWSPFHGASYAVIMSVAKLVAAGAGCDNLHFSFQEYFGKPGEDAARWGAPFSALLGAFTAQLQLGHAAIGGKDSMSGTFRDLDVPPTLVSFAVAVTETTRVITPELKTTGNLLVAFEIERDAYDLPAYESVRRLYANVAKLIRDGVIVSCYALDAYGLAAALSKMAFGNEKGIRFDDGLAQEKLFVNAAGNLVAEIREADLETALQVPGAVRLGQVTDESSFVFGADVIFQPEALQCYSSRLEKVFPTTVSGKRQTVSAPAADVFDVYVCRHPVAKPRVFIPVFPGTNCEYDLTRAFERAGAEVRCGIFRNLDADDIRESVRSFADEIDKAQILMFPGGFSAGDEPDGSAKFFAVAFRNEIIRAATERLLSERDGLVLGICNGFQAMIKLGLLPYGVIRGQDQTSPTLTCNEIGRHVSCMAHLKVVSNRSPWLQLTTPESVYLNPVSHGEGRFVGDEEVIRNLFMNGQVATQYCMPDGRVTTDDTYNVNGSYYAIEGITSPDGRCFGKMAHAERIGAGVAKNIYGEQDMRIFEAGVRYFR